MDTLSVRLHGAVDRGFWGALCVVVFSFVPAVFLLAGDVFLQNETVTGSKTVSTSDGSIYAGSGYSVRSPGNVTFKAFGEIDLKPGFTVSPGAAFKAYLIGTENDPEVRYGSVTGTVMLNGAGAANVALTLYGYNTYGRWVSKTALSDARGGFAFTLAEGTYALGEQADNYVFSQGEVSSIRVSGAGTSLSPEATVIVPTDTRLAYYHHDMLGNSVAMTNDNGGVIMRSVFYPFGDQHSTEGEGERYLFTGKERDATGLDYFGVRYFEPSVGRFTGIDPENGESTAPQSWNRYAYCYNNPYKYTDPKGEWPMFNHFMIAFKGEYAATGSVIDAMIAGLGSASVDSIVRGSSPLPVIGEQGKHFNVNDAPTGSEQDSRIQAMKAYLEKAAEYDRKSALAGENYGTFEGQRIGDIRVGIYHALAEFYRGSATHPFSDIDAHADGYVMEGSIGNISYKYHNDPLINGKPNEADVPEGERFNKSEEKVRDLLSR